MPTLKFLSTSFYVFSYDNPKNRDYRQPKSKCKKVAQVEYLVPKTTLRLERLPGVKFSKIKSVTAACLDTRKGRAILFSSRTGRVYIINNSGNRPGIWLRSI